MNRNVESHFAEIPSVDIERSVFDRSKGVKTSLNVGDLVVFDLEEVLPGDSFRVTTSKVCRLQTLLTPVMDNLYLDTYWFFVPNRLVWNHWKEFCGENTQSAWIPSTEYQIPTISAPEGGFAVGTIADYMGLPVGVNWSNSAKKAPSALPFRGYALICNEFFRDENLTDPLNIPTGDANQTGTNGDSYINDVANGGKPFKAARYHDRFSSCLPNPQKGPAVTFGANPIISSSSSVPVFTGANNIPSSYFSGNKLAWTDETGNFQGEAPHNFYISGQVDGHHSRVLNATTSGIRDDDVYMVPSNLYADLTSADIEASGVSFTINELRLAFQLQKFYEKNARAGTRYIEILKSHFGVTSPDSRLQRPEYLGGNRVPVQIHEVTNNAQSEQDFLGDLGAMSVTSDIHDDFEHSFTEHGYIFGLCVLRYDNTYSQGLDPLWTRKKFTDFYLPVFANIGEQPVYACEIYADAETMDSDQVFGYNEAWSEYRYGKDMCTGEMRPGIPNTLASWHFGDYYTQCPTLSDEWIRVDKSNVDRTLAVTSAVANQAFMDIYIQNYCTRPMPMYSIPGLIDHH